MFGSEAVQQKLIGMLMRIFLHNCLFELAYCSNSIGIIIDQEVLAELVDVLLEMTDSSHQVCTHSLYINFNEGGEILNRANFEDKKSLSCDCFIVVFIIEMRCIC